jgi:hypothetical protein
MLYVLSKKPKLRVWHDARQLVPSPQTQVNIKNTLQRLEGVDHIQVRPSWGSVQTAFRTGFDSRRGRLGDKAFLPGTPASRASA